MKLTRKWKLSIDLRAPTASLGAKEEDLMIDEAFSAAEASYDDAVELMDDLESQISQTYSDISDSLNACENRCQFCQDCYNDSESLYDDIMSVHS